MVLKDTIANSIISLEEAISNIQPGGQEWSEHPATQDVDLDGHKITGLGEPTEEDDAATKGYVDAQAGPSDRITGGAGTTYEETEIGVGPDATGYFSTLLRGVNRGDVFLEQRARENSSGTGHIGWKNTRSGYGRGYVGWSSNSAEIYGQGSVGNYGRVRADGWNGGNVYFEIPGSGEILLGSHISHTPNIRSLPSGVNSILHGIKLGVDAHDELANYDWSEYPAVQDVDLSTFRITNLADPTNPQDAATKAYVDANSGGGGPTDRIESESGAAFAEATDDFMGAGVPALVAGVESNGAFAQVLAFEDPGHNDAYAVVWAGPNFEDAAGFSAIYNTASDEYTLQASGAPLEIEEPVESYHAATKGYVDSQLGGGGGSLLTSDDANTFITASNDSLITGFDQYSKKLVVEEFDPNEPGTIISKSIEEWDDIARDEAIWGSVDGAGKAFMRTNYAFVEDSNDKSWGFQWINNVFEEYSHHGINISQGDSRLTFATVDTSSGDFYLASETLSDSVNRWSQIDIRKNNIEIRAAEYGISDSNNATSFKIEPNGSSTNKPLSMGNNRITNVEDPTNPQDAATKAYVDANSGGGGPTDRIESPSGGAFAEATDDFAGAGLRASVMGVESNGTAAHVYTYAYPGGNASAAAVSVGPVDDTGGGAGFTAIYDAASDAYSLRILGAPLHVEEPVESYHAATKAYVDSQFGGGGSPFKMSYTTWDFSPDLSSNVHIGPPYAYVYWGWNEFSASPWRPEDYYWASQEAYHVVFMTRFDFLPENPGATELVFEIPYDTYADAGTPTGVMPYYPRQLAITAIDQDSVILPAAATYYMDYNSDTDTYTVSLRIKMDVATAKQSVYISINTQFITEPI